MSRKLVLKRLAGSDLTFFGVHYKKSPGTKQKSFNLDRKVLVDELFPALVNNTEQRRFPIDLSLYGPGGKALHNLQRKILKQAKNWRLNGELVNDPEEQPGRYDVLRKDDFALIEFGGALIPDSARILLISKQVDPQLHQALENKFADVFSLRKGMVVVVAGDLLPVVEPLDMPTEHPILDFIQDTLIDDVLSGDAEANREFRRRRAGRPMDQQELENSRQKAAARGREGEELVNAWLETKLESGEIIQFSWVSDENAVAPFDFTLTESRTKGPCVIDVKSTSGEFGAKLHISGAELEEMAHGERPYFIFRVTGVGTETPALYESGDMREFALKVLAGLAGLPDGVRVDGVSVDPNELEFHGSAISLSLVDGGSEELP